MHRAADTGGDTKCGAGPRDEVGGGGRSPGTVARSRPKPSRTFFTRSRLEKDRLDVFPLFVRQTPRVGLAFQTPVLPIVSDFLYTL